MPIFRLPFFQNICFCAGLSIVTCPVLFCLGLARIERKRIPDYSIANIAVIVFRSNDAIEKLRVAHDTRFISLSSTNTNKGLANTHKGLTLSDRSGF